LSACLLAACLPAWSPACRCSIASVFCTLFVPRPLCCALLHCTVLYCSGFIGTSVATNAQQYCTVLYCTATTGVRTSNKSSARGMETIRSEQTLSRTTDETTRQHCQAVRQGTRIPLHPARISSGLARSHPPPPLLLFLLCLL
jgi:hypothetical protein